MPYTANRGFLVLKTEDIILILTAVVALCSPSKCHYLLLDKLPARRAFFNMGSCSDCRADCDDMNLTKIGTLRFVGTLCIAACIVEFTLGLIIFRFLADPYLLQGSGSWWAPTLVCVAGFCACFANNRSTVIATCVLATFGFCFAAVGAFADGKATITFSSYTAAGSVDQFGVYTIYGDGNDFESVESCAAIMTADNSTNSDFTQSNSQCYCVTAMGAFCASYELNYNSSNCGDLLGTYLILLKASTIFCSAVFFIGVVLSALSCTILVQNMRNRDLEPIGHMKWFDGGKAFDPASVLPPTFGIYGISSPEDVEQTHPQIPPYVHQKRPEQAEHDFAVLESPFGRSNM